MGRRISYILDLMEIPYVAIDTNVSLVNQEYTEGKPVYFGDAQRPEVLRTIGVANAPFAIITIDDIKATEHVVSSVLTTFPEIPIFTRAHDYQCSSLKTLGAQFTISETLESSGVIPFDIKRL
jgi:voltage-gated potassium channel Kch